MKPIQFEGCNTVFAKDQPEYLPLPAHVDRDNRGAVTSCWSLTLKERLKLLFTGRIYFTVWTFNQPLQPQRPSVENPIV